MTELTPEQEIVKLKSKVRELRCVCAAYDAVTNALPSEQFLAYVNAVPEQYRKFAALCGKEITLDEP